MLSVLKTNFKIALFSGLIFLFASITVCQARETVLYKGRVNSFALNIRQAPSQTAGVVTVAKKAQIVDVIEEPGEEGSWLKVSFEGQKGYIRNRPTYVKLTRLSVPLKKASKKKRPLKKKPKKVNPPKKIELEKAELKKVEPKKLEPEKKKADIKKTQKPETVTQKTPVKPELETETASQESQKIKEKIVTQEKLVQTFTQKERDLVEGLNEIDYALNKARLNVKGLSSELEGLGARISSLSQDKDTLKQSIETNRGYAGNRLRALYKMNMIGRLDVGEMPTTIFDFFLTQNSMKRIIQVDFNVLELQTDDLETLRALEEKLQNEILAKTRLEAQLKEQIRINKKETLKKELILKDIRQKKRLSLAVVESLREAEIRLDSQIQDLKTGHRSSHTGLSFSNYRGRLNVPVQGKIISRFGPAKTADHKSFTFQKGIDIKVERGEPVKSVFKGQIMFAQWLKGYGNLLIIDHGENYYTLYAHVEEIFKLQGETVGTGEVIATAGDTGSIKGMCLHFEVRHHGKPVNPLQWLKKGA